MTQDQIAQIIDPTKTTMLDVHYGDDIEFFEPLFTAFWCLTVAIAKQNETTAEWWARTKPTIVVVQGKQRIATIETPADLIALQQAHFQLHTTV